MPITYTELHKEVAAEVHGINLLIVTDKLPSYGAALRYSKNRKYNGDAMGHRVLGILEKHY